MTEGKLKMAEVDESFEKDADNLADMLIGLYSGPSREKVDSLVKEYCNQQLEEVDEDSIDKISEMKNQLEKKAKKAMDSLIAFKSGKEGTLRDVYMFFLGILNHDAYEKREVKLTGLYYDSVIELDSARIKYHSAESKKSKNECIQLAKKLKNNEVGPEEDVSKINDRLYRKGLEVKMSEMTIKGCERRIEGNRLLKELDIKYIQGGKNLKSIFDYLIKQTELILLYL